MFKLPKLPKFKRKDAIPSSLVQCTNIGRCEYRMVWNDGYSTIYSAAVQLGYADPASAADVEIIDGGTKVKFKDGTVMSAELIRVDAMQKTYRALTVSLLSAFALLAALYWLLLTHSLSIDSVPIAYALSGLLCSVLAWPLYRTRCYVVNFFALALACIGMVMTPYYPHAVVFVVVGFIVQLLYIHIASRLSAMGYDS